MTTSPSIVPEKKAISKTQLAYDTILEKILSNEFSSGMFLSIRELSEQLNLSRTPIKDALIRLSFEGFVDQSPETGVVVSKVGLSDVLELYEVRFALESHAAYLAATRRQNEDIQKLQNYVNLQRECSKSNAVAANRDDDSFHIALAHASYNSRLASQIETTILQCRRAAIYQNQQNANRIIRSVEQHDKILQAIIQSDPDAAQAAMFSHINDVIATTKELMFENYYMYK